MKKLGIVVLVFLLAVFTACEKEVVADKDVSGVKLEVFLEFDSSEVGNVSMVLVSDEQKPVHYFTGVTPGKNSLSLEKLDLDAESYYISAIFFDKDGKYINQLFSDNFSLQRGEGYEVSVVPK